MIKLISFLIGFAFFLVVALYKALKILTMNKALNTTNAESRKNMLKMNQIKAKTHEEVFNMDNSNLNNRL